MNSELVQTLIPILSMTGIILQILDVISTNKALAKGGVEQNPIIRWYMGKTGKFWYTSKIPVIAAMLVLMFYGVGWVSLAPLMFINSLYILVVLNNFKQ